MARRKSKNVSNDFYISSQACSLTLPTADDRGALSFSTQRVSAARVKMLSVVHAGSYSTGRIL